MSKFFTKQDSIDLAAEVEAQLLELKEFAVEIQKTGTPEDKAAV